MNFLKKIPPYYVAKKTYNLINNGNIKLEDDYVFKGSNAHTKMNELKQKNNNIYFAYDELKKNVKKYQLGGLPEKTLDEKKLEIISIIQSLIEKYYGEKKDEAKSFLSNITNLDKLLVLFLTWNAINSNSHLKKYNKDPNKKDELAEEIYNKRNDLTYGFFPLMWMDDGMTAIRMLLDPDIYNQFFNII